MIFYTLFGPTSKLEIHDDVIKLKRNPILGFFHRKDRLMEFKLSELSHFAVTEPKVVWGKVQCATSCGKKADFRFTTNSVMMGKIEKYLNTLIAKNERRNQAPTPVVHVEEIKPVHHVEEFVNNVLPFAAKPKVKAKKEKVQFNKKKIKNRNVA